MNHHLCSVLLKFIVVPTLLTFTLASIVRATEAIQSQPLFVQQPVNSEAEQLLRTAFASYRQGKLDDALSNCMKIIAMAPNDPRGHILLGYIYRGQNKLRSASEAFAKAIQLRPDDPVIYVIKADVDNNRNAQATGKSA